MKLTDKNIREKEFHNKLQSKSKARFENIFYKAIMNSSEDFFDFAVKLICFVSTPKHTQGQHSHFWTRTGLGDG